MQPTVFRTVLVPGAGSSKTRPVVVARGSLKTPVRVLIRNVAAVPIFLAGSDQDVVTQEGPTSETFRLGVEASEVFVLAPKQSMYAVGAVAGGLVSVSISEELTSSGELVVL